MIRAGVIGIGNMGSNHCENIFPARCRDELLVFAM